MERGREWEWGKEILSNITKKLLKYWVTVIFRERDWDRESERRREGKRLRRNKTNWDTLQSETKAKCNVSGEKKRAVHFITS